MNKKEGLDRKEAKLTMYSGRWAGKKTYYDYITNNHLETMEQGQTFGLCTFDGVKIFRLEEIRKKKEK